MMHAVEWRGGRKTFGQLVERRYRVTSFLGSGACGSVFAARALGPALHDHGIARVALKVLNREHAHDQDAVARFTHEAFLGSRLHHPNLVRVLDYGHVKDGRPYYTMELCQGASLSHVMRVAAVLPPMLSSRLIGQAACALACLHAHGIVHRDVKPGNLFLVMGKRHTHRNALLYLLDLGLAGVYDASRAHRLGSVDVGSSGRYGTPSYLCPEQALGAPVDPRADIYGLACVAYRVLTGREPLAASSLGELVRAHIFETPPPATSVNPQLPARVDEVLSRALAKRRSARTPCVMQFADELAAALAS